MLQLTKDQLDSILEYDSSEWLSPINHVIYTCNLNTVDRLGYFLGQILYESVMLRHIEESFDYNPYRLHAVFPRQFPTLQSAEDVIGNYEKIADILYAGLLGNGDIASGDGWKYHGRGAIQLTGKTHYIQFNNSHFSVDSTGTKYDFTVHPELVATNKDFAIASAGWYWDINNINAMADRKSIQDVTRAINGARMLGLADREALTNKVLTILNKS